MRTLALGLLLCVTGLAAGRAQSFTTAPCPDNHDGSSSWFGHDEQTCELRRTTLPLGAGHLSVTGNNGNIEIIGEDRSDIALEATVTAHGSSHDSAQALLHQIRIVSAGDIHAEGPRDNATGFFHHGGGWSASYKLRVPHHLADAQLRTSNGNIDAAALSGQLRASSSNGNITLAHIDGSVTATSTNGGLRLDNLAGDVHAETTNGGVTVALAGARWHGNGIFAKSTNGGITLKAPERFAAHLSAQTTNGGISVAFPITLQGKIDRHLDTDLNGGGPPVRLETTNGGITVDRL